MKVLKNILIVITTLMGLFFASNIYVIGNSSAALNMHTDINPAAPVFFVYAKVIVCFIAGILYIISAYGIIKNKFKYAGFGIAGSCIFFLFYILELLLWGAVYSKVWFGFSIFGSFSLLIGILSFIIFNKGNNYAS